MARTSTPTIPPVLYGIWDAPARCWVSAGLVPTHAIAFWSTAEAAEAYRETLEASPADMRVCPIAAQMLPPPPPPIAGKIEPSESEGAA